MLYLQLKFDKEIKGKQDNVSSTTTTAYILSERGGDMEEKQENTLDVRKVFQAIADILGERYGQKVELVSIQKKETTKEETA